MLVDLRLTHQEGVIQALDVGHQCTVLQCVVLVLVVHNQAGQCLLHSCRGAHKRLNLVLHSCRQPIGGETEGQYTRGSAYDELARAEREMNCKRHSVVNITN